MQTRKRALGPRRRVCLDSRIPNPVDPVPKTRKPRLRADSIIPKALLAKEVARILDDRQLTQTEAAYVMRDAPSQISLVVTGKLRGFSVER